MRDELPAIVAHVQADEDVDLPLPTVTAGGRNEVERLAAAFTDVNATTLRIAREQAILRAAVAGMFVNVARRNQTLLSRQLSFIDHLERTEENPDSLENLFRLDHLAARMRRNAESLLVLAGVESGRRLRHAMPLSDVVRTATSEIEHFDRVSLVFQADPPVYPHLALPTAHLLAELLENATNFSDPGSEVIVATAGHADGVRLTITDSGLGMTDEELEEANARIAEPPASEGIGSQRLGFFVVGRLAQRLGAQVTLRGGRARGTVVTVDLPVSLFEAAPSRVSRPRSRRPRPLRPPCPPRRRCPSCPPAPGVPEPYTPPMPTVPETPAAASGGLPRRGAPAAPAATAAPAAPAVPAPAPAPEPAAAPEAPPQVPESRPGDDATAAPEAPAARSAEPTPAWSPTLPETWAPLPAQTEPSYQPEVRPGVGMPAATPTPGPAGPEAPAAEVETAPVDSARPALFSGFRSRREASVLPTEAEPTPAVAPEPQQVAPDPQPVFTPEPPAEVPSPWSPEAYEPQAAPEVAEAPQIPEAPEVAEAPQSRRSRRSRRSPPRGACRVRRTGSARARRAGRAARGALPPAAARGARRGSLVAAVPRGRVPAAPPAVVGPARAVGRAGCRAGRPVPGDPVVADLRRRRHRTGGTRGRGGRRRAGRGSDGGAALVLRADGRPARAPRPRRAAASEEGTRARRRTRHRRGGRRARGPGAVACATDPGPAGGPGRGRGRVGGAG